MAKTLIRKSHQDYTYGISINPYTFTGVVGKVRKTLSQRTKEERVEKKSTCSASTGARARTQDLPRARGRSPAAR